MRANEFLTESTFNIGKDVDLLYNKFFRQVIKQLEKDKWDGNLPETIHMTTSELQSLQCRKAHEANPMRIITTHDNEYNPGNRFISISIGGSALNLVKQKGGVKAAISFLRGNYPQDVKKFKTEFTPARIKGSIYHELSHWLDDTFHNRHIRNKIDKAYDSGDDHSLMHGEKNVGLTRYELNAQVHGIKQLKRNNLDMWDLLSFNDMLELSSSLIMIRNDLSEKDLARWKKMLISRMAREKLVGAQMR